MNNHTSNSRVNPNRCSIETDYESSNKQMLSRNSVKYTAQYFTPFLNEYQNFSKKSLFYKIFFKKKILSFKHMGIKFKRKIYRKFFYVDKLIDCKSKIQKFSNGIPINNTFFF